MLLQQTLEYKREKFCDLILEIVNMGMIKRKTSITREEIKELNKLIEKVGFKIPDLWNAAFLDSLPSITKEAEQEPKLDLITLNEEFKKLTSMSPQNRGFAFEKFLKLLFSTFGLKPRSSFRLVGEQIDGSFELDSNTYLVEAKWHNEPVPASDLRVFRDKIEGKAHWSRGVFISFNDFSQEGLAAFTRGKATNAIGITGQDLYFILNGEISLPEAIRTKARRAAETGDFYISIYDITRNSV